MHNIRWGWAILLAFVAEILLIICAIAWVFIYSFFIHPGQPAAAYEAYAQVASPYVAVVVSFPLFFLLAWWLAQKTKSAVTVWAFFAVWFVLDLAFVLGVGGWREFRQTLGFSLVALAAKAAGTYFGLKRGLS